MANTTLARKPSNDMKKSSGLMYGNQRRTNQDDKGLGFNGQDNGSSQGLASGMQYSYNQHSGTCNEDSGFGQPQMPNRKGNLSSLGAKRVPPATAAASKNPVMSGERSWSPSAGQNYKGNPDQIQERQLFNRVGNKD